MNHKADQSAQDDRKAQGNCAERSCHKSQDGSENGSADRHLQGVKKRCQDLGKIGKIRPEHISSQVGQMVFPRKKKRRLAAGEGCSGEENS